MNYQPKITKTFKQTALKVICKNELGTQVKMEKNEKAIAALKLLPAADAAGELSDLVHWLAR